MSNSAPVEAAAFPSATFAPNNAQAGAEEIERVKGLFLASLNHEVRTPLSGILGMTDLLLETSLDEEQLEYVQAARLCAGNLLEILNAALEYSALEAGHCVLDEMEFSLRETLDAALQQHRSKAQAKGLRLVSIVDASLPETVMGDSQRLSQLLGYLVSNAIKFTSAGSVELHAWVDRSSGEHLVFEVRDTGIGIAPEQRDAIFASFRQLDIGLARSYEGLGLGLALARKLANLMDGTISVESALGQGSRFTLRLPPRPPVEHPAEVAAPIQEAAPAILAVEDNPVGLTVLRRALERHALVTCVASGRAALEAATARRYDLVLMDLHMPEMDGLEATEALRKIAGYHDVPILALTANASDDVRERCRQAGMQAFLAKPVEAASLWSAVSKFL